MPFYILAILLVIAYALGDWLSKEYSLSKAVIYLWTALISYTGATSLWLYSMYRGVEVGKGSLLFALASSGTGLVIGCGFYHEQLTLTQWLGAILGIIAIVLLSS